MSDDLRELGWDCTEACGSVAWHLEMNAQGACPKPARTCGTCGGALQVDTSGPRDVLYCPSCDAWARR